MFPSSNKLPPPKPAPTIHLSSSWNPPPQSPSSSGATTPPPQQQHPPSPPAPVVYRPSIYSYTCRGAWYVSSMDQFSEGTCRGLQSRLELLADMDDSTRDVAIKGFTYMTDYELDEDDGGVDQGPGGGAAATAPGGNGLNQKTKSILISPALIYKEKVESASSSNPQQPKKAAIEMPPPSSTSLPEEDLIRRQKWSCYGSTEVELLVLKNLSTGNEHIAAVAPRNVGVSIRKIDADDGSITSIGIGWLNIVVDAGPSFLDDDEEDDDEEEEVSNDRNPQRSPQSDPLSPRNPLQKQKDSDHAGPASSSSPPEEVPPRPSQDSIVRTRAQLKKFYEFVGKVGDQMVSNVNFLKDTMQDDFVKRSIAAGHKIVDNVPRTVDRTANFMQKMLDRWTGNGSGGGSGGDEPGGDHGGGDRGPGP